MNRIDPEHRLLLQWLLFVGVLLFSAWLAWDSDLLVQIYQRDPTRLSLIITCLFVVGTAHCAARTFYISSQLNHLYRVRLRYDRSSLPDVALIGDQVRINGVALADSLAENYWRAILVKLRSVGLRRDWQSEHTQLTEVLAEQARGNHEMGWFLTGLLIKLGLLGTVIGFVLMLGSFTAIESFDVSDVQNTLKKMTVGMGVALNTTLIGLIGSMLLGFQYLLLDRGADKLIADSILFAEVKLIPAYHRSSGSESGGD